MSIKPFVDRKKERLRECMLGQFCKNISKVGLQNIQSIAKSLSKFCTNEYLSFSVEFFGFINHCFDIESDRTSGLNILDKLLAKIQKLSLLSTFCNDGNSMLKIIDKLFDII
jgi:hypothetical protein